MPETAVVPAEISLVAALRGVPVLADLPDVSLLWLAEHSEDRRSDVGTVIIREGDPAEYMNIILQGKVRFQREGAGAASATFTAQAGQIGGLLPYSRLTHYTGTVRAMEPTRALMIHKDLFPEMLRQIPELNQRLVGLMADRIREITRIEQQHDNLVSLGKLSAGLAHELNNPAAAAKRAAGTLRETLENMRKANARLDHHELTQTQRKCISRFECELGEAAAEFRSTAEPLDALALSDREERLTTWLQAHNIESYWTIAPSLAESCVDPGCLDEIAAAIGEEALADVLIRLSCYVLSKKLVAEVEHSTTRISDLVSSVKNYSYMDQAPEQEIDIHDGLESTLTMLGYKLRRNGIAIVLEFDRSLPKIVARGSELNQVWTNLIDNAADAMPQGGRLLVRTRQTENFVVVDIQDSGFGIPAAIQSRIFEPFFTTKPVGQGTGLGLDTVRRIVQVHNAAIQVQSEPGCTRFSVTLPLPHLM